MENASPKQSAASDHASAYASITVRTVLTHPLTLAVMIGYFIAMAVWIFTRDTEGFDLLLDVADWLIVPLLFVPITYLSLYVYGKHMYERDMWDMILLHYQLTPIEGMEVPNDKVLYFSEGHNEKIERALTGTLAGKSIRIFNYAAELNRPQERLTKMSKINRTTVYQISFDGQHPHLYLNNRKDAHHVALINRFGLQSLSLSPALDKIFTLYVPLKYEIESLAVFTPTTIQWLHDIGWQYDIEITGGELYVFRPGIINSAEQFISDIELLQALITHMTPILDRGRYAQVGDLSPHLTRPSPKKESRGTDIAW